LKELDIEREKNDISLNEISEILSSKTDNNVSNKYNIHCIVHHIGNTPYSGHYVCDIKREGVWKRYDDSVVKEMKKRKKYLVTKDNNLVIYYFMYMIQFVNNRYNIFTLFC